MNVCAKNVDLSNKIFVDFQRMYKDKTKCRSPVSKEISKHMYICT